MTSLLEEVRRLRDVLDEAEPVKGSGDLRKIFPRAGFRGWKVVIYKPKQVWFQKGLFEFRVENDDGFPSVTLKYPEEIGGKILPSGMSWGSRRNVGRGVFMVNFWADETDWPDHLKHLHRVLGVLKTKVK